MTVRYDHIVANPGDISELAIRPALEYVIEFVRQGRVSDPGFRYPAHLRQLLARPRLLKSDLRRVRKAVDGDEEFRALMASSMPDDADLIVRWWITRPEGWEDLILTEIEERARQTEDAHAAADVVREQRRRRAAEQRAQTAETARDESLEHITSLRAENDALREELAHYESKQQELYETIAGLRQELRHANDRLQAAQDRLAKSSEAEDQSVDAQRNAEHVRDLALEDRRSALANLSDLGGILLDLRSLGQRLEAALPHEQAAAERLPLPTPGRLNGNPQGMTIHLLKSTATVIVDGYNVTKGTWPDRSLEQQRELLIAATEQLAARFGTHLIIVFDGADIAGAHRENRSLIRVMYSPNGITADDVIREEVRRLPLSRPVVVITDDQAIQRDVRSEGANIVSSAHFSQVLYS